MKVFCRVVAALTTAAIFVTAILCAPIAWFRPVVAFLAALAIFEYGQLLAKGIGRVGPAGRVGRIALFLAGVAVLLMAFTAIPLIAEKYGAKMLLYVIAIVKFSDMGGFAIGLSTARFMKGGNHKMCPTISPNKSWEGLGGSVAASILMSLAFMPITGFAVGKSVLLGVVAALVGTFGDLVESKFKRWVGVKDSATFMPAGMGGFLDMFDSLLFAPVLIYALM